MCVCACMRVCVHACVCVCVCMCAAAGQATARRKGEGEEEEKGDDGVVMVRGKEGSREARVFPCAWRPRGNSPPANRRAFAIFSICARL